MVRCALSWKLIILTIEPTDMGRKRKADIEDEEQQFSQQAARIRNSHVHKARFRTIGETGIEVRTTTNGHDLSSREVLSPPQPIADDETSYQPDLTDDQARKQTQVHSICCYVTNKHD